MEQLISSKKGYTLDQDKVITPDETIKKALEIISSIPNVSGFSVIENTNTGVLERFVCSSNEIDTSGKGITNEQCKASALMEYIERYSWMNFDYKNAPGYQNASYSQIRSGDVETVKEDYFLSNYIQFDEYENTLRDIQNYKLKWVKGEAMLNTATIPKAMAFSITKTQIFPSVFPIT